MNKHLRRLLLVVIAVVLGLNIYRWNAKNLLGNELPMPFHYGTAIVLSESMAPRLNVDDLVIVKETDTVEIGDIIIYHDGSSLVIHRVIAVNGETIITQGDANNATDDPITMDDVKGVMVLDVPKAGAVVRFLRRPVVVILILAIGAILMELSFRKDKQKNQKELSEIENEIQRLMTEIKDESK